MERRDTGYYDFLGDALNGMTYQEFVDFMLVDKQNGLKTPGFSWDAVLQTDFNYDQIEAELGIKTMATYVDYDSPSPMKSVEGISLAKGSIPRMKQAFPITEKMLRERSIIYERTAGMSEAMRHAILRLLFSTTEDLILGNYNSLTYQRDQMVSTGKLTITKENNPGGYDNITFSASVPDNNRVALSGDNRWFTDMNGTEGAKSDPVKDLKVLIKKAQDLGLRGFHFEVEKVTFEKTIAHSKVRQFIGWNRNPMASAEDAAAIGAYIDGEEAKRILERVLGVPIVVNDNVVSVESFNKTKKKLEKKQTVSFAENVWVLVPNGSLGTIKSVRPIRVGNFLSIRDTPNIAFFDHDRMILEYLVNDRTNTGVVTSELTALVVPDKPKYMFYLTVA